MISYLIISLSFWSGFSLQFQHVVKLSDAKIIVFILIYLYVKIFTKNVFKCFNSKKKSTKKPPNIQVSRKNTKWDFKWIIFNTHIWAFLLLHQSLQQLSLRHRRAMTGSESHQQKGENQKTTHLAETKETIHSSELQPPFCSQQKRNFWCTFCKRLWK